ncbi:hypothetical protein Lepto7375DRAFT_2183 [Leptolyngbya sp. PCC 7375]|nr:hypothetical protein Lepto7375DRAFT_2183 [Leptolyngbya sp. PCC 7375]
MSKKTTELENTVLEAYRKNIKKLIEYLSPCDPNEHGFCSSLAKKISQKLEKRMYAQYISGWYDLSKPSNRGFITIYSAAKLGYGGGLHSDPNIAMGLVFLALSGIWNPEEEGPEELLKRLKKVD